MTEPKWNLDLFSLECGTPFEGSFVKLVSASLGAVWSDVETALLSVRASPSFDGYLANYRGLPLIPVPLKEQLGIQGAVGNALFTAFSDAFRVCAQSAFQVPGGVFSVPARVGSDGQALAYAFEGVVNLALGLWCGNGDRNFQYRSVVHFCALEGLGDVVWGEEGGEVAPLALSFSEHGVRLASPGSEHFPVRLALSHVLIDDDFFNVLSGARAAGPETDAFLVARLRSCQRELCLLVDDWEHENALLAVEHTRLRQGLQKASSAQIEEAMRDILDRMGELRDSLSLWCLRTFTAVERMLGILPGVANSVDVEAERDALSGMLLAGVQKIHLPASVSRHRYHADTFEQLSRWCDERLARKPDDASTLLVRAALASGSGEAPDWARLEAALRGRTYEWSLDYDPSSALKACCWRLMPEVHLVFAAFYLVMVAKKLHPAAVGNFWLSTAASVVQMPESYPSSPRPPPAPAARTGKEKVGCPASLSGLLRLEVLTILARPENSGADSDCLTYLVQAFQALPSLESQSTGEVST